MKWLRRLFCAHTWRRCPIEKFPRVISPFLAVDEPLWREPLRISWCIHCGKVVQHYGPLLSFEEEPWYTTLTPQEEDFRRGK